MYTTYPQNNSYDPYYNGYNNYAPMPQPMPVQAPVAQSAAATKGLLMVAGLAVVGAVAFGGVMLMNSNSQPEPTAASTPSTVVNLPSTIEIPSLTPSQDGPSSVPVIVNNPAPVRVYSPGSPAIAPAPAAAPAPAPAPAAAPAPADTSKTEPAKTDDTPKDEPKKEEPKKESQEGRAEEGAEEGAQEGRAQNRKREDVAAGCRLQAFSTLQPAGNPSAQATRPGLSA